MYVSKAKTVQMICRTYYLVLMKLNRTLTSLMLCFVVDIHQQTTNSVVKSSYLGP